MQDAVKEGLTRFRVLGLFYGSLDENQLWTLDAITSLTESDAVDIGLSLGARSELRTWTGQLRAERQPKHLPPHNRAGFDSPSTAPRRPHHLDANASECRRSSLSQDLTIDNNVPGDPAGAAWGQQPMARPQPWLPVTTLALPSQQQQLPPGCNTRILIRGECQLLILPCFNPDWWVFNSKAAALHVMASSSESAFSMTNIERDTLGDLVAGLSTPTQPTPPPPSSSPPTPNQLLKR
jgi:hypothetical protein